jgi:Uma2 family endonuclease
MGAAPKQKLTYDEYLALEAVAEERHEFHDGEMFAMSGGSPAHARLIHQVSVELGVAMRGKRCVMTSSAQRVRLLEGRSAYPDATIVCPPLQRPPEDPDAITNPTVVVEVLSPTTEAFDRGAKFRLYRELPSVRHVVFVRQDAWRVEHYRRMEDGTWRLSDHGPGDTLLLDAVEASLAVDALYEDIEAFDGPARS